MSKDLLIPVVITVGFLLIVLYAVETGKTVRGFGLQIN